MYYEVFLSPATEIVVLGQLSGYLILKRGDTGNYWYMNCLCLLEFGDILKRTEFRHLKVLYLLDEDGVKLLETLKDEFRLLKHHYRS